MFTSSTDQQVKSQIIESFGNVSSSLDLQYQLWQLLLHPLSWTCGLQNFGKESLAIGELSESVGEIWFGKGPTIL